MLVVMRSGSSPAESDAVRVRASDADAAVRVEAHRGRTVVTVEGAAARPLRDLLASMPGVEAVAGDGDATPQRTRDLRVASIRPLVPPTILLEELPLSADGATTVLRARDAVCRILDGRDDRLIVVVGPCSVHDTEAALDYGRRLMRLGAELATDLCVVMRVYFEKPRTTVGWKGLINDPRLDGSFAVNDGLRLARRLLLAIADLGLPAGCEFLDPILPQFLADAVSWGAIGARTTESQTHRELASGLSMPIGFKNGTGGGVQMAVDAAAAAAYPHRFLGVTEQGLAAIVATAGNPDCHVILRGGKSGPNYDAASVAATLASVRAAGLPARVMIDTSHGNSEKDFRRQPLVADAVAAQVAGGEAGIIGLLLESFLVDGRQEIVAGTPLTFGQSVTDGCMGWEATEPVLRRLAAAVRTRRAGRSA